ncbi:hypothetical protein [Amycolatopsis sp. NPDC098790]|uniref:hypothetical protein n=1 Tax=Amycolatopsis sp. NPDC098790 TaxID=3363939 RepID=UPI00380D3192
MRLVRLERQQSRVADDVRAALASLGRGSTVIGGIALVGVGSVTERPIEAVVLLPHGVIIVIGVDLPDPALRLEAPLGAEWKADGWPLVADDDAINPATEALDISQACERRIASLVPGTGPVGTIVAVGPYVETVDQPATDLAGPVRVLHPTPTTMLAATVSLATAHRPRSVDQVRALIRGLAPEAPEFSDEVLLGEGFSRFTDDSPPESLWDGGPPVPSQAGVAAGSATGSAASAEASAGPASAVAAPSLSASNSAEPGSPSEELPAADPAEPTSLPAEPSSPAETLPADPGSPTVDNSGWHTKTPVAAKAEPAPSPADASEPAAEPEVEPEADLAPSAQNSGAEASSPLAEPERTEVLPSPDAERTEKLPAPALPLFPGAVPPRPAEADTERTENLTAAPAPTTSRPTTPQRPDHTEPARSSQEPEPPNRTQPARPNHTEPARSFTPSHGGSTTPRQSAPDNTAPQQANQTEPAQSTPPSHGGPTTPGQSAANHTEPARATPPAAQPHPPADSPRPFPTPRPTPREAAPTSKTVRWIPLAAIGLLVALVVAAIVVATSGENTETAAAPTGAPSSTTQPPPPTSTPVARSLQFSLRAADHDQRCASHAFGDAQASLQQTSCSGVRRASYAATVDGRAAAVTIGIVEFPAAAQAAAFKAVADTPGGGGVLDLAAETGKWGATPAPRFENAAYASKTVGNSVRIVQAVWVPGPSTPDDPGLTRAVQAALDLPAQ